MEIKELRNIPQELKLNALWCYWKLTENGKVPINPRTEQFAKSNDETTFAPYMTLLNKLHKYWVIDENGKQTKGIGLGVFRGFSAIDIDHCVDNNGVISDLAKDIIDYCQSYTEYSPSGTGIRIIFKTNQKIDKTKFYIKNSNIGLEIYISNNTNRFVTMTGRVIANENLISEVDINYILNKYMLKRTHSINDFLNKDDKLYQLWNSQAPGSHANESEMDMSLCCKLAYYLKNDVYAIKQAFESSPYYASKDEQHKEKWNREDYWTATINGAIDYCGGSLIENIPLNVAKKQKYGLNDTGNANRFYDKFRGEVCFNVDNQKWMIWNGMYWEYDIKGKIRDYVDILVEEMYNEALLEQNIDVKKNLIKNVEKLYNVGGKENLLLEARRLGEIPVTNAELDKDNRYLCCLNGVVDLITGELLPHKKSYLQSQNTGCSIDLVNEPTKFIKFIRDILKDDDELINYVQKILGYSLLHSAREQCMWIFLGDGNDGKSLLLDVVRECVGSYGIVSRPTLLTEQRNGNTNLEEIARLKGKRFVFCEETKEDERLDESLVKSLTSGIGNMVARFLYGNSFEFNFRGTIFMASNHRPIIRGIDRGIWRRMKVVPFTRSLRDDEVNKDLKYELYEEKSQILGWLVKGCLKYQQEGLKEPEKVNASVKDYRNEMDIVSQWLQDRCEVDDRYYEKASVLFQDFNSYCIKGNQKSISMTSFGRNLTKKFVKKTYNGCNVYLGVRLKVGNEDFSKQIKYDKIKVEEEL